MSHRILKSLTIALVIGIAFPVQAAVAKQVDDQMVAAVQTSSTPVVSEKTDGLFQVIQPVSSRPLVSEKTAGLVQPLSTSTQPVLVSTRDGFDWSDAGIGAGVLFGTMLLGTAAALTLRRHRGTLAH